jgi:energy-coupling factor transporter ATP-binding protein EcfA2
MLPPVTEGVAITVRKLWPNWFTLDELAANGTVSTHFCAHLVEAVERLENILISGPTGSGKTTLVKALLDLIPKDERVLLIEDTAELPLTVPIAFASPLGKESRYAICEGILAASARPHHRGRSPGRCSLQFPPGPQHWTRGLDFHAPREFRSTRAELARAPGATSGHWLAVQLYAKRNWRCHSACG